MNEDDAHRLAWRILGEVEEMMSGSGVGLFSEGQSGLRPVRAFFMAREYESLENTIVDVLTEAIQSVGEARAVPMASESADRERGQEEACLYGEEY